MLMPTNPTPPKNKPVARTVMTLTMIHPVELDPAQMSQSDIAYHLGDGEFVGTRTAIQTSPVPDDEVAGELERLGGDRNWFVKDPEPPIAID